MSKKREGSKNNSESGPTLVMEPPEPPEMPESPPAELEAESDLPPEAEETAGEPKKAGRKEKRGGRGHHIEPAAGFFSRLSALTNEDWQNHLIYVYRLEPFTDNQGAGSDTRYIWKYRETIDEDRLLHDVGSGRYRVLLDEIDSRGRYNCIDRVECSIENPDFPPKIPFGAWVDHERNKKWAWAKSYYEAQAKAAAAKEAAANVTPMSEVISVVREVLDARLPPTTGPKEDTVLNAVRTGVEMARASVPQGETAIVTVMREALADSRDKANKLEDRVLNLLTERAKPAASEEPKTPLDQITQVAAVIKAVDEVRPPKGYRPADPEHPGWGILNTFVAGITPALGGLVTILSQRLAHAGQPQAQRQAAPQPKERKPAPELPPPTPPPGAAGTAPTPGGEPVFDMSLIPPVLRDHFMTALMWANRGDSGADFADWLSATWPDAVIAMRSIGSEPDMPWSGKSPVDAMIWIAQQIPPIWAQISSVPGAEKRLRQFISEILAWTPQAEPQEPEEPEGSETTLQ